MSIESEREELVQKEEIKAKVKKIDYQFFSKQRGFMRDFGLTVFPFFTFFDALLNRIELDLAKPYEKLFFWQRWWYRAKIQRIEGTLTSFYQTVNQQWEGVQRDAAERFVERYEQLLKELHLLYDLLPLTEKERCLVFIKYLSNVVPFFEVTMDHHWQDEALDNLGAILGERAFTTLPSHQHFVEVISKIRGNNYLEDIELMLQEERIRFHQDLHRALMEIYQALYVKMEHSWHSFHKELEPLLTDE